MCYQDEARIESQQVAVILVKTLNSCELDHLYLIAGSQIWPVHWFANYKLHLIVAVTIMRLQRFNIFINLCSSFALGYFPRNSVLPSISALSPLTPVPYENGSSLGIPCASQHPYAQAPLCCGNLTRRKYNMTRPGGGGQSKRCKLFSYVTSMLHMTNGMTNS